MTATFPSVEPSGVPQIDVWTAERMADRDLARLLYDHLLPHRDRNAFVGQLAFLGCVEHLLGTAAGVLGRPEADDHLRRALARYQAMAAPAYAARVTSQLEVGVGARG
jgi:hypothetical protein